MVLKYFVHPLKILLIQDAKQNYSARLERNTDKVLEVKSYIAQAIQYVQSNVTLVRSYVIQAPIRMDVKIKRHAYLSRTIKILARNAQTSGVRKFVRITRNIVPVFTKKMIWDRYAPKEIIVLTIQLISMAIIVLDIADRNVQKDKRVSNQKVWTPPQNAHGPTNAKQ